MRCSKAATDEVSRVFPWGDSDRVFAIAYRSYNEDWSTRDRPRMPLSGSGLGDKRQVDRRIPSIGGLHHEPRLQITISRLAVRKREPVAYRAHKEF